MKIILNYTPTKKGPGMMFKTDDLRCSTNEYDYIISFSVQEKISKGKIHTRISKLNIIDKSGEESGASKSKYKDISEKNMSTILKIESQYLIEMKKRNTEILLAKENNLVPSINLIDRIEIDLDKKISMIPSTLSTGDIQSIINIKENNEEILRLSVLKRMEEFREEWDKHIKNNSRECIFQKLLNEYPEVLSLIFPRIYNIRKLEYLITSKGAKDNKIDIICQGEDKTIIELKRPSTNLFSSIGRNNISGLSKELVSSSVQLSLYNKRVQNNSDSPTNAFTYGMLIIGNTSQMDSEEKILSWKLFKENFKYQIYTFDEILMFIEKIISNIKK